MRCIINILLLEDDTLLAESVIDELEDEGYDVTWAQESQAVIDITFTSRFNLYLFDVNVPGMSGFDLLSSLRESGDTTPAIFMTSLNQLKDLREGFRVGADDYIKKPFDLDELLIRVASKLPKTSIMQLSKNFSINPESYQVTCKDITHNLPFKEFELLRYFIKHKEQLLEVDKIIDEFNEATISIATLRTYIKNLKRHVEGCALIENIKGVGYRFRLL